MLNRRWMEGPFLYWYDNFSKIYRIHVPSQGTGLYHSCLWTGVAIHAYQGPDIDMKCRLNPDQSVLSIMPPNLFDQQDVVINSIQYIMDEGGLYFDKSLCKKHTVNNIPLKIITNTEENIPFIPESVGTMGQCFPLKMMKENIGSNRGLAIIMRELYEKHEMHIDKCSKYVCLNVDENIFWRMLKVYIT